MTRQPVLIAVAAAALALPAWAQSLKPGLWEVQSRLHGNPQMEQAMAEMNRQMAGMSPAQRKQMQETMARQGVQIGAGAGGATATRICMTREMAERGEVTGQQGDCRTHGQQRIANTLRMAFTCTQPPARGETQVTFLGPEAYSMKMTSTTTVAGKDETVSMEGSGKWVAADCGNIRPLVPPKK
ncbi:DUF3617 domain-containing protein [Ramlibacter tataouinensis]|uniref:DUF3617 domain-containing protein n=1 Tax=Ramlibacter tataouinensis (strain ATCC BAA-407 / DSM 14655 / LMG 21543 / TTB310) TaxID=365046 RepID=F5Y624_RAMTT|nr:DUF3617 domain-containing protein [Ramlibacter tataouinensis]AEG91528.1 Conserved hypothetical protein [Ramlibacter tataouinensis TTB310]